MYEFLTILAVIVKYFLIVYAFILAAAVITKFILWKRERDRMKQKAQEPIRYIYTKEGKIVNLSRQQKS